MEEEMKKPEPMTADNSKLIAALGYVPFLCFLPLMQRTTSEFLAFHGRQGLLLTIICIALAILSPILSIAIPLIGMIVVGVADLILLGLVIMGALKAYQGEKWVLPVVGPMADALKF